MIGNEQRYTGSQINYYFVCKRKLWLFSHNIELESDSDLVKLGKLLHENKYKRRLKEVQIDRIKIDFIESKDLKQRDQNPSHAVESTPSSTQEIIQTKTVSSLEKQGRELVIHEVKRSRKMHDAHLYQLLFYIYSLKKDHGISEVRGVLHYPLLNQNVDVPLTGERIRQVEEALAGMVQINSLQKPPEAVWKGYCRSCAYGDLCWG